MRGARKNIDRRHPVWMAGEAAHKFMSYIDSLKLWREVTLRDIYLGTPTAERAFTNAVDTVQGRYKVLQGKIEVIFPMLKTQIKDKTLDAVAGSWGLMEEMRCDF
jgi:hypothetical protein